MQIKDSNGNVYVIVDGKATLAMLSGEVVSIRDAADKARWRKFRGVEL